MKIEMDENATKLGIVALVVGSALIASAIVGTAAPMGALFLLFFIL